MSPAEIQAMWARWAHRSDLTADMATIQALAMERIRTRMMGYADFFAPIDGETGDEVIARTMQECPQLWCAAGLIEVFRLAADEAQMTREATVFEGSASDFIMRLSLAAGPAHAVRSYPNGN